MPRKNTTTNRNDASARHSTAHTTAANAQTTRDIGRQGTGQRKKAVGLFSQLSSEQQAVALDTDNAAFQASQHSTNQEKRKHPNGFTIGDWVSAPSFTSRICEVVDFEGDELLIEWWVPRKKRQSIHPGMYMRQCSVTLVEKIEPTTHGWVV